ncbi:MAG TPA: response regulator [Phycisphaerae bacterium]|nr:response regulator [Phycisphaerae bacterium]
MSVGNAKILFIDDDPDMHDVIEIMLAGNGYEIQHCRTGDAGLQAMLRARPDLVLLDIMLADPNEGLQLACQMRQNERLKTVPIVFLSAIGETLGIEYGKEVCPVPLAVDMFLEKPVDAATVRAAVRQVLDHRSPAA